MASLETLRDWRIGPLAVFDTVGTLWLGYSVLPTYIFPRTSPWTTTVALFLFAEAVHMLFKIDTPVTAGKNFRR